MSKIVERTLAVFELFATEKKPLSLTDMTRLLEIPLSSCHDVLRALEAQGYLYETAPRAGYYPTRRLLEVAQAISSHDSLLQRTEFLLQSIRDELQETVTLAKASGNRVIYLQVLEPENPIRFSVRVGAEIRSLYATSAGKAFLASLPASELNDVLKNANLARHTRNTICSKAKLLADIELGKTQGWFLNNEESIDGVTTLSSGFSWGNACYIITVAGITSRMQEKLELAARLITKTCGALSDTPLQG